ncbi:hypothetical protein HYH03_009400 [Edaphochlamys debaryana]|uniref:Tr-type G domain-containing protein n=1 Tax=Edaphochlamys debaryana TaxID=47281 RepID=A0A836BYP4_9CHLO|nr:hypothetical protein HYH03_009400 [Edaphochlamys debaryana]|eukprot:KAG2492459.1 hypothetical protein HYH03_009400 [Edaphochlamys debaryana]
MGDSWEDMAASPQAPAGAASAASGFNVNAPAFNPNSMIFVPGQGLVPASRPQPPPPPPPAPAPAPVVEQPPPPPAPAPEPEPEPVPEPAAPEPEPEQNGGDASEPAPAPAAEPEPAPAAAVPESVVEEPVAPVDESAVMKAYQDCLAEEPRDHLNIVFIGHIDAGKSTLAGQILFLTGGVDKRTIEKYEREAKEKNREGWYMAYIMDTNEEERVKGITVEVGRAHFETDKKRYTILDAPGHKNYVPNMIQGACQADVAILVISARKGEFETGFERGGQTREHAQLAKTLGVTRLIVVVNKLDCGSVALDGAKWDRARFDQIVNGLTPFLKQCGYNMKKEVTFLPLAALYGHNIKDPVPKEMCDWYDGETLFQVLDHMEPLERNPLIPFRMPIVDRWKDMGTIVMGKSEAGFVRVGDVLQVMPNKLRVKVDAVFRDEKETQSARSGENLRLRLSGCDETDISPGFVLSSIKNPVPMVTQFEAQLVIIELLEHNPIFTVGYKSVLHIHTACEECEVSKLVAEIDPKTKEQKKTKYIKQGGICIARITVDKPICIESFADVPSLGRFTLRDEGRTIAIGKVVKLPKVH